MSDFPRPRSKEYDPPDRAAPEEWSAPAPQDDAARSVVDRHSVVVGKFRSARNLHVEGQVEGEVECEGVLFVAEKATIKARVTARDITVAGRLEGEVTCSGRLEVTPTGHVHGSATAARVLIQEGASFEGELHMARQDSAEVQGAAPPPAAAAPPPQEDNESAAARPEAPIRRIR